MTDAGAVLGTDGLRRCGWGDSTEDYRVYHDTEWGRPVHGDDALFERVCLEAFQSGLSWITILRRREGFRAAFAGFVIDEVAAFGPADVERLLGDAGIIRNRAKIEASIANARVARDLDGGLDALIWQYAGDPDRPAPAPWRRYRPSRPSRRRWRRRSRRRVSGSSARPPRTR